MKQPQSPIVIYRPILRRESDPPSPWLARLAKHSTGTATACTVVSAAIGAIVFTTLQTPAVPDARATDSSLLKYPMNLDNSLSETALIGPPAGDRSERLTHDLLRGEDAESSSAAFDPGQVSPFPRAIAGRRERPLEQLAGSKVQVGMAFSAPTAVVSKVDLKTQAPEQDGGASDTAALPAPGVGAAVAAVVADFEGGQPLAQTYGDDAFHLAAGLQGEPRGGTTARSVSAELANSTDTPLVGPISNGARESELKHDEAVPPAVSRAVPIDAVSLQDNALDNTRGIADQVWNAPLQRNSSLKPARPRGAVDESAFHTRPSSRSLRSPHGVAMSGTVRHDRVSGARRMPVAQEGSAGGDPVIRVAAERREPSSVQVSNGQLVSVQLSTLLELLETKMDRPLYVWLKTSGSAERYVTPSTLAKAGISAVFDPDTDQLILSIADKERN